MLTPGRVCRAILTRVRRWADPDDRKLRRRRRQMTRSLDHNLRLIDGIRKKLTPGQKLTAIVLTEHLGDIIACEPVIRHLRRERPNDCLIWIIRDAYAELISAHPQLDDSLKVTCLTEALEISRSPKIDRVVDLHLNQRRCTWFGTVHVKIAGETEINVTNYLNYGSLLESFSRSAGLPPLHDAPRLYLPPKVIAAVDRIAPRGAFVVLHAAANEEARNWTGEKWAELIGRLREHSSMTFVEVGLEPMISNRVPGIVNLCGKLSLAELAEVIRRSTGFIGVESGPAHMANAFNRPSVILMGRYRIFERYLTHTGYLRENSERMLIQWKGPAADIPVDLVARRARDVIGLASAVAGAMPRPD